MMAPLLGVVLLATATLPLGALCAQLHADTRWTRHRVEMDRLTAPLPVVREELAEPEPVRRVPGEALRAEGFVDTGRPAGPAPDTLLLERVAAGLRGLDSDLIANEYEGRHRGDDRNVIGSSAQEAGRRALREPTDAFDAIIAYGWDTGEREALAWRCGSCTVGRERERRHQSCPGCGCPCRAPQVMIGRPPLVGAIS